MIIPWFNVGFFIFLTIAFLVLRGMWRQFRERMVDPLADSAGHRIDDMQAGIAERRSGFRRWLATWRRKS